VMQRYTKLDPDVIDGIWGEFVFQPALTQSLIDDWNAEAVWAKETGKVPPTTVIPDFRSIVVDRFLRSVQPSSVTLR
jgi:hypothetical protein